MFILNGKPLALDIPFTTPDGTQYPANWLRLSSPEEKEAIGITEEPDEIPYDQRYYWGYDQDGNLIPKDLEQLKEEHIRQTKETANLLLTPTDWYVIRKLERNIEIPQNIVDFRTSVVEVSGEREVLISSATTVEELKGFYEYSGETNEISPLMPEWPILNN